MQLTFNTTNEMQSYILNLAKQKNPDITHDLICMGSRGSGKTWMAGVLTFLWCLTPNTTILLARRTRASMKDSVISLWCKEIIPKEFVKKINKVSGFIEFINGSKLITTGTIQIDDIKSSEVDGIVFEEANQIDFEAYSVLVGCLRKRGHPSGRFSLICTNGVRKNHWIAEKIKRGEGKFFHSEMKDNKFLPKDYVSHMIRCFGSDSHWVKGGFADENGTIFNGYHDIPNILDIFNYQPEQRIIGIDLGGMGTGVSTTVVIGAGFKEGKRYIEKEWVKKQSTHPEVIANIHKLWKDMGEKGAPTVVSDPANAAFNRELQLNGCILLSIKKSPGSVQSYEILLNSHLGCETLYVHPDCDHTIDSLINYDGGEKYKDAVDVIRYILMATEYW